MTEVAYIKKTVRNENEISNMKLFLNFSADAVPSIKTVEREFYLIEKCKPIEEKDFCPDNFEKIYNFLSEILFTNTHKKFSKGIYKYFYNRNGNTEKYYVPYLLKELEESIQHLNLGKDEIVCKLLANCKKSARPFLKWNPTDGFNLLHGDLHIGNIVKRNEKYLLIDYEYARYGARELEVANFIISCLVFYEVHKSNETKIMTEEYLKVIREFHFYLFPFFLSLAMTLYYLSALVKNKENHIISINNIYNHLKNYE